MKDKFTRLGVIAIGCALTGCSHLVALSSGDDTVSLKSHDRSFGTLIDDATLETTIKANLIKLTADHPDANISVTCYNKVVLLIGNVPNETLKEQATEYVEKSGHVKAVVNELVIGPARSWPSQTSDTWLTTKVNANMLATEGFPSGDVEVISENGVVYLMGIVSEDTAATAVAITKRVYGVQKIVKLFEYVEDIANIETAPNSF